MAITREDVNFVIEILYGQRELLDVLDSDELSEMLVSGEPYQWQEYLRGRLIDMAIPRAEEAIQNALAYLARFNISSPHMPAREFQYLSTLGLIFTPK